MFVVAMSSLFSFQSSSSTACNTSFGVQAFLVGSLLGQMTGFLLDGSVFDSLALITEEPLVGVDVRTHAIEDFNNPNTNREGGT